MALDHAPDKITVHTVCPASVDTRMLRWAADLHKGDDTASSTGLELDAIAAVVIGGASLSGGRGSLIGTFFGVIIMVCIRNGLNLLGIDPYWQGTAVGSIIIAAVLAECWLSRRHIRG